MGGGGGVEAFRDKGFISKLVKFAREPSRAVDGVPRPAGRRRALTLREIWRQLSRRPTMEVAAGRLMGAGRRGMMLSLLKPFVCDTQRLCPLLLT